MRIKQLISYTNKILLLIFFINVLLLTNTYGINPQRKYLAKPDAVGLEYQTYKIKVNDSTLLNSWACLQKDIRKPFIIISGSDAGNMTYSLAQAKSFYESGYNVILYDYRGFGESSDFKINHDMLYYNEFAVDLKSTINFVKKQFKPNSIVLYGLSMGTIISRMNLDDDKVIKGLVLDSFVINPKLLVERYNFSQKKEILLPNNAANYFQSNTINLNKPVLIFSGLKDDFTKTEDYKDFLLKNPNSKMVTSDCKHLQCFVTMGTDPNMYMVAFNTFVNQL